MANPSNFTLVQTVNPATSTGTITATPAITLTGSLIIVFMGSSALTDTVSTVTDNGANTYTKAYSIATGTGGNTECWYSINAKPTTSIVITFSASASTKSIFVREYSGMSPATTCIDRTITASGSGTAVSTGASSVTRDANELVVCNCSCLGTNPTNSVGAGFGNYTSQTIVAGASLHSIEDLTASTLAAQTGLMTAGGTSPVWDVGAATFVIGRGRGIIFNSYVKVGNGMSRSEVAS
jgi:hypothetical protein